jgi:hypothetical protein
VGRVYLIRWRGGCIDPSVPIRSAPVGIGRRDAEYRCVALEIASGTGALGPHSQMVPPSRLALRQPEWAGAVAEQFLANCEWRFGALRGNAAKLARRLPKAAGSSP